MQQQQQPRIYKYYLFLISLHYYDVSVCATFLIQVDTAFHLSPYVNGSTTNKIGLIKIPLSRSVTSGGQLFFIIR